MAFLLAQADFLTVDKLRAGISEQTVEEDPLMSMLPFEDIAGHKQVAFNRENSLGGEAQWSEINEVIAESAPTYTNVTQALSILRAREEIDHFVVETKDAVQNVLAATLATKAKQMWRQFHDTFYYGVAKGASSSAFAGLHNLVSTSSPDQVIEEGSGSTGSAGSLARLSETITRIKPGKPDALALNRNMLRRLSAPYISNVQYNLDKSTFGDFISGYAGIPFMVTDFITQTETISGGTFSAKTGSDTTSIFGCKWGSNSEVHVGSNAVFNNDGLIGIQGGPMRINPPHEMEQKAGFSIILEWYCTVILGSTLSLTRMDGITDAAWVV